MATEAENAAIHLQAKECEDWQNLEEAEKERSCSLRREPDPADSLMLLVRKLWGNQSVLS